MLFSFFCRTKPTFMVRKFGVCLWWLLKIVHFYFPTEVNIWLFSQKCFPQRTFLWPSLRHLNLAYPIKLSCVQSSGINTELTENIRNVHIMLCAQGIKVRTQWRSRDNVPTVFLCVANSVHWVSVLILRGTIVFYFVFLFACLFLHLNFCSFVLAKGQKLQNNIGIS